jgi:hypothetical protein
LLAPMVIHILSIDTSCRVPSSQWIESKRSSDKNHEPLISQWLKGCHRSVGSLPPSVRDEIWNYAGMWNNNDYPRFFSNRNLIWYDMICIAWKLRGSTFDRSWELVQWFTHLTRWDPKTLRVASVELLLRMGKSSALPFVRWFSVMRWGSGLMPQFPLFQFSFFRDRRDSALSHLNRIHA